MNEVKGRFPISLWFQFFKNYRRITAQLIKKYGDKFALKGFFRVIHFCVDPHMIRHILLTNSLNYPRPPNPLFDQLSNPNGDLALRKILERWKKMRANHLNPTLTENSVKHLTPIIVNGNNEHLTLWAEYATNKKPITLYPLIQRLSLDNLKKALLGNVPLDNQFVIQTVDEIAYLEIKYELAITKIAWKLPTQIRARTRKVMQDLRKINEQVVDYCLSDAVTYPTIFKNIAADFSSQYHIGGEKDLRNFLCNIAGLYMIAGFDSISHALPITFAYTAMYPDVAEKIRAEIKTHIGNNEINADNVELLRYTQAVFMEGLRHSGGIFPVLARECLNDETIGSYTIKKGETILIPIYHATRLPQFWENPEAFYPERFFSIDTMDDRYRFVHLTFGSGINACAGRNFAILECTLILAMALRKFQFELIPFQHLDPDQPAKISFILNKI